VLQANFLREDLPYFTELLAEVLSQTRYTSASYTFPWVYGVEDELLIVV
jgi:hypothetical protein